MGKRVLSTGHNSVALRSRNLLIQQAGYQVTTTKETGLLLELAHKDDFDAVVFCNSIPAHLRESVARELKRLKPTLPLIMVYSDDDERKRLQGLADELVIATGTSQALIEAIARVTNRPIRRSG